MNSDGTRSIKISSETFDKIKDIGKFGESLDDVLNRVVTHYIKTTHKAPNGKFDGKGVK